VRGPSLAHTGVQGVHRKHIIALVIALVARVKQVGYLRAALPGALKERLLPWHGNRQDFTSTMAALETAYMARNGSASLPHHSCVISQGFA
jgi:hypothetical protein